jgi:hypothetical protein
MNFDEMTWKAVKDLKPVVIDEGINFSTPRANFLKEVKAYAGKLAKSSGDESFNELIEAADKIINFFEKDNIILIKEVKSANGIATRTKKAKKA